MLNVNVTFNIWSTTIPIFWNRISSLCVSIIRTISKNYNFLNHTWAIPIPHLENCPYMFWTIFEKARRMKAPRNTYIQKSQQDMTHITFFLTNHCLFSYTITGFSTCVFFFSLLNFTHFLTLLWQYVANLRITHRDKTTDVGAMINHKFAIWDIFGS
jgi:hypothetical protein